MRTLAVFIALQLLPFVAHADGSGMYLCSSPIVANDLWTRFLDPQAIGQDKRSLKQLAAQKRCRFVQSSQLKPIDYALGQVLLSDGKGRGWAATQYYVLYSNQNGSSPPNPMQ